MSAAAPSTRNLADDGMPLIRLRGVTKVYGEGALAFAALKGVDLDIARGDFVAIMGPSGSGKSTAMNTLGCLDRPTTGDYLFQGAFVPPGLHEIRIRYRGPRAPLVCQLAGWALCLAALGLMGVERKSPQAVNP